MTDQAKARQALRERQREREARASQRIRLARIAALEQPWDGESGERAELLVRLAIEAIKAEPSGLSADKLPTRLLTLLVERGRVATFRGVVVARGGAG